MARKTSNATSARKTSNTTSATRAHVSEVKGNIIEDFNIENVRVFKNRFDDECAFFDLDLGFMFVKGLLLQYNKDGEGYITFQSDKYEGSYYKRGYLNDESLNKSIVETVENIIFDNTTSGK